MQKLRAALMSLLLLVAACAPSTATTSPTSEPIAPTPTAEAAGSAGVDAAAQTVSWLNLPLVNARTGEAFTFADFGGKTVLARTVGTW
jgi:hypothetical protein